MGLIQTPDQLRFSYMAIIEGAKYTKGDSNIQNWWKELSKKDYLLFVIIHKTEQ